MLRVLGAVLYTALLFGANGAVAQTPAVDTVRTGDMRKLAIHAEARAVPEAALVGLDDSPRSLADYKGKWVVLNFWATWCAPCRKEMPSLDRLQASLGGDSFSVVTVATGRNPVPAIKTFFTDAGVTNLPALRDPKSALARSMGVMGLPLTVILNPEGQEVARLIGDAEWDSPDAKAVLAALMAGG